MTEADRKHPVVEPRVQLRPNVWTLDPTTIIGFASEFDRAWAAGFFDGEGSVNFRKSKKGKTRQYYSIHVSIGQSMLEPLEELREYYGGNIYTYKPGPTRKMTKNFFQWSIVGTRASVFLKHILPYLRVKKEVAEASLNAWEGRWEVMPE